MIAASDEEDDEKRVLHQNTMRFNLKQAWGRECLLKQKDRPGLIDDWLIRRFADVEDVLTEWDHLRGTGTQSVACSE